MTTNFVSCFQKINLVNDYSNVEPIDLNNVPCDTPGEAIVLALFSMDNTNGSTLAEIQTLAAQLCPLVTAAEIETRLEAGLQTGLFRALRPSCINWLAPMPPTRYTFNKAMDQYPVNGPLVQYLVGLAGGFCRGEGSLIRRFFNKYVNRVDRTFRLYGQCDEGLGLSADPSL
jgi:hypothetical protein